MLIWLAVLAATIFFATTAYSYLLAKAKRWGMIYPTALYAGLTILANIFTAKTVQIGPFITTITTIPYAITFTITDITDEVMGRKPTHHIVWATGILNVIAAAVIWLMLHTPPAPFAAETSELMNKLLSTSPRIFLASATTFFVSQHHDVWAFHFWRQKTKGKYLWLRNNLSTATSQLIDTAMFFTLAFAGVWPIHVLLSVIVSTYVFKLIIVLADTPFVYLGVKIFNRFRDANY
ncbi:MAG: VUT family protein [Candidatus Makaraimicrobium thalassicum]|nr:MAG: VUT family protein [Candidatus Omnitrophota bacterium]